MGGKIWYFSFSKIFYIKQFYNILLKKNTISFYLYKTKLNLAFLFFQFYLRLQNWFQLKPYLDKSSCWSLTVHFREKKTKHLNNVNLTAPLYDNLANPRIV